MDIARLQKNWTNLGAQDPLWAILSEPRARGGEWDLDAFLATGRDFIGYLERYLGGLGVPIRTGRALDFGCGYGRLSQALARRFDAVVGVDIAASMIEGARRIDRTAGRCEFVHNTAADLRRFADGSFDFVLTVLVLQHMRPDYSLGYLREFLRVLAPGGVLFFQLPQRPLAAVDDGDGPRTAAPAARALADLRGNLSVHPGQIAVHSGEWRWYRVHVHNGGDAPLRAGDGPGRIQLAARWQNLEGAPLQPPRLFDLSRDVAAGETLTMLVPLQTPWLGGYFVAAFLPVQGGQWIETPDLAGARVVALVVERQPGPGEERAAAAPPPRPVPPHGAAGPDAADEAEIEVHGLPVHEVIDVVRGAGGEVVDVCEDAWAGPDWLSAHYTVVKV